uniref:Inheritance of peroxisomes protein 1 n=2 Tax=Caenorhabditis tropicalis TaxID=1561998 RepID=A0A1I7TD11_9PELO
MFSIFMRIPDTAQVDAVFSEAYASIEQGLCYDEVGDWENTLAMYEKGFNLIKEGEKMKNAKKSEMWKMLQEAKTSVEHRIKILKKEGPKRPTPEKVKEAEDSVENQKEAIRMQLDSFGSQEAELVYFLPEGVQLFTVDGEKTTAPTAPTSLQILRFPQPLDNGSASETRAFIQVGPWVYPLMGPKTPVLRNEFGAYLVANPTPENPNMSVAILLSSDIEPHLIEELHIVLREYTDFKEQTEPMTDLSKDEKKKISTQVANFLIKGGQKIAWGVETTTVKVISRVEENGEQYRTTLIATDKPMQVSPVVRGSVVYMHKGTKTVAKCTRYLLDKIGDMGVSVGRTLADSAQRSFGNGKTGGLVSGTIEILGGGIAGVSTVWMSLEDGSRHLCRSIANQTVQNVKIKYGDDASDTTHHALFAAGHGTLAAAQLWDLGPRSVAGRMARKAGIQMVSDLHHSRKGSQIDREVPALEVKKAL